MPFSASSASFVGVAYRTRLFECGFYDSILIRFRIIDLAVIILSRQATNPQSSMGDLAERSAVI